MFNKSDPKHPSIMKWSEFGKQLVTSSMIILKKNSLRKPNTAFQKMDSAEPETKDEQDQSTGDKMKSPNKTHKTSGSKLDFTKLEIPSSDRCFTAEGERQIREARPSWHLLEYKSITKQSTNSSVIR